ncbi:hypothetical protein ACG873_31075 [Mesorhizobium sp. AaZ16]|uniref:hypothetical protein n=1 Tax=Mesorhizobium sp. AaZ16 TaxID=3402289 RepID=UPI00374F07EB
MLQHRRLRAQSTGIQPRQAPLRAASSWKAAYKSGQLNFFGEIADLTEPAAFSRRLAEVRRRECCGCRRFANGVLAHVWTPAVQQALRDHYFDELGLPRLYVSAQA